MHKSDPGLYKKFVNSPLFEPIPQAVFGEQVGGL
jgi:hypothetical protein